jgi:F-type H+-transporting ATPase subunit alpha
LSQYRDLEAFAQFGSDLDPDTQRTLARGARLVKTLNQNEREPLRVGLQVVQVYAATNGFLDRISVDRVDEFLQGLTQRVLAEGRELIEKMEGGDWSDETQKALRDIIATFADDFGYDLDEDGQPISEGESDRVATRPSGQAQGAEDAGEESEAQQEAAGAAA